MPFELLPTIRGSAKKTKASISYMRMKGRGGAGRRGVPRLVIGIPASAAGADAAAPAQRTYVLRLGNGADTGKLRIMLDKDGVTPRAIKGGFVFRFGHVPTLGDDAAAREMVEVRALPDEGGWEITLPPWFRAEQAETPPPLAAVDRQAPAPAMKRRA